MPGYTGLKIGGDCRDKSIKSIKVDTRREEIVVNQFGRVGYGGNSGFQAVNLAVQFGCRTIILVGFDMSDKAGIHWHGEHVKGLRNPTAKSLARWRGVLDAQAEALKQMGVRVLNAAPNSALTAYPKMTFSAALAASMEPVDGAGIADADEETFACAA